MSLKDWEVNDIIKETISSFTFFFFFFTRLRKENPSQEYKGQAAECKLCFSALQTQFILCAGPSPRHKVPSLCCPFIRPAKRWTRWRQRRLQTPTFLPPPRRGRLLSVKEKLGFIYSDSPPPLDTLGSPQANQSTSTWLWPCGSPGKSHLECVWASRAINENTEHNRARAMLFERKGNALTLIWPMTCLVIPPQVVEVWLGMGKG